jgi:Pyridoxamine 5'-phosphate oxidase
MLTDDLHRRLSGAEVDAHAAKALLLCTSDAEGWPHPAMLSYFEVAAVDLENIRLAVYKDSRTSANMRERGKATLIVVDVNLVYYVRCSVTPVAAVMSSVPFNAMMNLRVEHVKFDAPPPDLEPDAFVTSGITYHPRTGAALAQARAVLAELRGLS